jgi:hypothetical protein
MLKWWWRGSAHKIRCRLGKYLLTILSGHAPYVFMIAFVYFAKKMPVWQYSFACGKYMEYPHENTPFSHRAKRSVP